MVRLGRVGSGEEAHGAQACEATGPVSPANAAPPRTASAAPRHRLIAPSSEPEAMVPSPPLSHATQLVADACLAPPTAESAQRGARASASALRDGRGASIVRVAWLHHHHPFVKRETVKSPWCPAVRESLADGGGVGVW